MEIVMTIGKRAWDRSGRVKVSSAGRPKAAHRAQQVLFWPLIEKGISSEEAAVQVGASAPLAVVGFERPEACHHHNILALRRHYRGGISVLRNVTRLQFAVRKVAA
jgi:hypothetical protein